MNDNLQKSLCKTLVSNLLKINKAPQNLSQAELTKMYDFLDKTPELHTPVLLGLGGSHAYGTNIATSDLDIRGIAMHSKEDILLQKGFEQVENKETDTVIYSLNKIINLLKNCNPNTIEMLGLKPEHYIYKTYCGMDLLRNRDMFLSNKCVQSFMGYANSQLYRLQQKTNQTLSEAELNEHICRTMNNMKNTLAERYDIRGIDVFTENGELKINLNVQNYRMDELNDVLGVFANTLRDYRSASKRNDYAIAHSKIAKHSMHLLRLYMMCEDMLLNGEINTYRAKEQSLLLSIRNGEYLDEQGVPNKEFFDMVHDYDARLQYAKEHSVLPNTPDMKRIDAFMLSVNERMLDGDVAYFEPKTSAIAVLHGKPKPVLLKTVESVYPDR